MSQSNQDSEANIEQEIRDLEIQEPPFFSRKTLLDIKVNFPDFCRYYLELVMEKPEAESYPIYFLPSLAVIMGFFITVVAGFYKILPLFGSGFFRNKIGPLFLGGGIIGGFWLGLKTATLFYKGNTKNQDISIITGIFFLPLIPGLWLAWFFSYGTWIAGILIYFIAHTASVTITYIAIPNILLLKGIPRFAALTCAIISSVFGISLILRILF